MDTIFQTLLSIADDYKSEDNRHKQVAIIQSIMDRRSLKKHISSLSEISILCREISTDIVNSLYQNLDEDDDFSLTSYYTQYADTELQTDDTQAAQQENLFSKDEQAALDADQVASVSPITD